VLVVRTDVGQQLTRESGRPQAPGEQAAAHRVLEALRGVAEHLDGKPEPSLVVQGAEQLGGDGHLVVRGRGDATTGDGIESRRGTERGPEPGGVDLASGSLRGQMRQEGEAGRGGVVLGRLTREGHRLVLAIRPDQEVDADDGRAAGFGREGEEAFGEGLEVVVEVRGARAGLGLGEEHVEIGGGREAEFGRAKPCGEILGLDEVADLVVQTEELHRGLAVRAIEFEGAEVGVGGLHEMPPRRLLEPFTRLGEGEPRLAILGRAAEIACEILEGGAIAALLIGGHALGAEAGRVAVVLPAADDDDHDDTGDDDGGDAAGEHETTGGLGLEFHDLVTFLMTSSTVCQMILKSRRKLSRSTY